MNDSSEFNKDWNLFKAFNWRIVDNMCMQGDGILMTELQAIAVFNPKKDDKIRVLKEEERFLVTEKFGKNRAIMADQDPDCQLHSKIFNFKMCIGGELEIDFEPSCYMCQS